MISKEPLSIPSNEHHEHEPLPAPSNEQHLVRSLGFIDVLMIGIAGLVGGAIFVLTGPAIGLAGPAVITVFVLNAIITLFTAMGYAELGSAMPEAGGGYLWVRRGLPRPNAFISGWMAWFAHIVAGSLYAVGFGSFSFSVLKMINVVGNHPFLGYMPIDKLIAVLSIVAFTYINVRGVSGTGKAGNIFTIIQLGTIAALIGAGVWSIYVHPNWKTNFVDFMPNGIGGIVAAMGLTFIAFEGYEIIVQTGEEVKDPKKNIPKAIFTSLVLVVVLYCLVAFVSIGAIFPAGIPSWKFIGQNGDLGIMKAAALFLPYGSFIVLAGGIVSSLAALNATTFSSSRVSFAMARHYNLPHQLSSIHPKYKTPHIAITISGTIMAVMAYAFPLEQIAVAAAVIFLLLFTQVNIAVITIRKIYGNMLTYGFRIPLFPAIPVIGIFLKIALALYLLFTQPLSWAITAVWVAIGFVIYRKFTFKKEIAHYAPSLTSRGDLARKQYRILMHYNQESSYGLIKYATRIAKENDGEVNILRVLTVPDQTPLSAGMAFIEDARKSYESIEKILHQEYILSHFLFKVSHDKSEAILETIEDQKINLVITNFDTFRTNKELQTLVTRPVLAIIEKATDHDVTAYKQTDVDMAGTSRLQGMEEEKNPKKKKKMTVIYDDGDHSDLVLNVTRWFEHSGPFDVYVLSIKRKQQDSKGKERDHQEMIHQLDKQKRRVHLEQIGVEFKEIDIPHQITNNSEKSANLIFNAVNASQPDLVITSATVAKFDLFNNLSFLFELNNLNCPAIVARQFAIPGIHRLKYWLTKIT